jgi:ribosome maturation factor RimP
MTELSPTIVNSVAEVLDARGLELYDVEVAGAGRARVVRVLVSAPGGVDLDAVSAASEAVSAALDDPTVAREIPGPYALEVSSPGLERPLRRPAHYRGAVGETLSVKLADRPRLRGALTAVDDDGITLVDDSGDAHRIPFADVVQARTVFEWGDSPGKPRRKAGAGKVKKEVAPR